MERKTETDRTLATISSTTSYRPVVVVVVVGDDRQLFIGSQLAANVHYFRLFSPSADNEEEEEEEVLSNHACT